MKEKNPFHIQGLSDSEILQSRAEHGRNELNYKKENGVLDAIKSLVKEPMVILLLVAAAIYFISGDKSDAVFMTVSIILVATISLYQDSKSRNALAQLKSFTEPHCKVIRNSIIMNISSEDLVVGDSMIVEEGTSIAADGDIIHSNDFAVNESILTGESVPVSKDTNTDDKSVYKGTTVTRGMAIVVVTAIGNETRLGKIGTTLENITEEKTPLEKQINNFVKKMVVIGGIVFLIVWAINFIRSGDILDSLLKALTLAMSILPEEIPVAFTTFMALGAWRLMKMGIIVKQMKTVETLGSATVICTDKTGTITENKMSIARVYTLADNKIAEIKEGLTATAKEVIRLGMWASEPLPFDPMETALHHAYTATTTFDERPQYSMYHEYPLGGKPPMMTHIFQDKNGNRIIAAKGAPEAFLKIVPLSAEQQKNVQQAISTLTSDGYRVLAVGQSNFEGDNFPERQQQLPFALKGIVAFYDPPKKNISTVLQSFYKAGINVKIVTGDNAATTGAIAKEIGFRGYDKSITGEALLKLSKTELEKKVEEIQVFSRMFPDAKLDIIDALKANKEIVAMTGDGVNDGPALKAAHIGIAMGKKGTEIAKQAASLILIEDDLSKMVNAVAMGRKIYTNLKKAIRYIISIHIPIILTVFTPLALNWVYPNIFTPVHVIFFELIMGPTCSIIYENEPMEKNTMLQKPRPLTITFFNWKELIISIIQGLAITCGTLFIYQYAVNNGYREALTRTMVFTTMIAANIFLTLINRSFYFSILTTLRYSNNLVPLIIGITALLTGIVLYVPAFSRFFRFEFMNFHQLFMSILIGFISVVWYEIFKWIKRKQTIPIT